MPQTPTHVLPHVVNRARGLNDQDSIVKEAMGFTPFALNLEAESDVWTRRPGRYFSFLGEGFVTYYGQLEWDDGNNTEVAVIGSVAYDMGTQFNYLFELGVQLIIQSPDGTYWSCTPDATTGEIYPTVVNTPSATPQTADVTIQQGQPFGFIITSGVIRLDADDNRNGWFLEAYGNSSGLNSISTDMVFTYSSGFAIRIYDTNGTGSLWELSVTNDGSLNGTIS